MFSCLFLSQHQGTHGNDTVESPEAIVLHESPTSSLWPDFGAWFDKVQRAAFLLEALGVGGGSASKLSQVLTRIQFLEVVGLMSLLFAGCKLGLSQLLETSLVLYLRASSSTSRMRCINSILLDLRISPAASSAFKVLGPTWIIQDNELVLEPADQQT